MFLGFTYLKCEKKQITEVNCNNNVLLISSYYCKIHIYLESYFEYKSTIPDKICN